MIQDLTSNHLSKPVVKDQGSMTNSYDPVDLTSCLSSDSSTRRKARRNKNISIGTQTPFDDEKCLMDVPTFSLAPYLCPRLQSPPQISSGSDSESESENAKFRWMFSDKKSCSRCHVLRPQVRLLRAIKNNMAKQGIWKPGISHVLKEGILPDKVVWDALGFNLQKLLVRLVVISQMLEALPLHSYLKVNSDSLSKSLNHLISHLPMPSNIRQNKFTLRIPAVPAMCVYLFGYRMKELIQLLQSLQSSRYAMVFPHYFRAEISVLQRVAHRTLAHALQDMRHMSVEASSLNSDAEFISKSFHADELLNDDNGSDDYLSSDSEADELDDSMPMPSSKRPITEESWTQKPVAAQKMRLFGRKIFKPRTGPDESHDLSHFDLVSSKIPSHRSRRLKRNITTQSSRMTTLKTSTGTTEVPLRTGRKSLRSHSASFSINASPGIELANVCVQTSSTQSSLPKQTPISGLHSPPLTIHSSCLTPLKTSTATTEVPLHTGRKIQARSASLRMKASPGIAMQDNVFVHSIDTRSSESYSQDTLSNPSPPTSPFLSSSSKLSVDYQSPHPSPVCTEYDICAEHSYCKTFTESLAGLNSDDFNGSSIKKTPITVSSVAIASSGTSSIDDSSGLSNNEVPFSVLGNKFTQQALAPNASSFPKLDEVPGANFSLTTSQANSSASCTVTATACKVGINSTHLQCSTAVSMLNAECNLVNSGTTSNKNAASVSGLPYFDVSPSTIRSLLNSPLSNSQAILGSSTNSVASSLKLPTSCPSLALSCSSASTNDQELNIMETTIPLLRPTILSAEKQKSKVVLTWKFPNKYHPRVAKYLIYFCGMQCIKGEYRSWSKVGSVNPCPLPMTLTLTEIDGIANCIISVKAMYLDGQFSELSDTVIV